MSSLFVALFAFVASSFRTRTALQAEILALRHQLAVFQKNAPLRLRLQRSDRLLWVLLSRWWPGWRCSLHIVRPDTVIAWHRRAFAWYWTRKSRRRPGRPNVAAESRHLIREMCQANPLWGAPRIHGELLKLGIDLAQSTVAKYLRRPQGGPGAIISPRFRRRSRSSWSRAQPAQTSASKIVCQRLRSHPLSDPRPTTAALMVLSVGEFINSGSRRVVRTQTVQSAVRSISPHVAA